MLSECIFLYVTDQSTENRDINENRSTQITHSTMFSFLFYYNNIFEKKHEARHKTIEAGSHTF